MCIGAGGEGTLISQISVIRWYTKQGEITLMISCCKFCARVALLICYYSLPQIYLASGGFFWPMFFSMVIVVLSIFCFWFYMYNVKDVELDLPDKMVCIQLKDLKLLDLTYYLLLIIRFGVMGAWFGFSAIFMQYLQAGCQLPYATAANLLLIVPFISMSIVLMNMFVTRYCDYLNKALLVVCFIVSLFLWISGFVVDKGMGMAVFALICIAISGGYYNVCIDTF